MDSTVLHFFTSKVSFNPGFSHQSKERLFQRNAWNFNFQTFKVKRF